jgi:hypothetical protein
MEMLIPMATTALQGIRGAQRQRNPPSPATGVPIALDSCYAYARHRDVVKQFWPEHHRPPTNSNPD